MNEANRALFAALGRLPSGLFVLTARRGDAETGMLASWVQQCSFEPPHISLALKVGRPVNDWLQVGSDFILNILDHTQTDMIAHFGRGFALGEPAFTGIEVERNGQEAPVLLEALGHLQCRIVNRVHVADHDVVIAEVITGRLLSEEAPMVHIRKSGAHY
jgi:flavin reductase (DIM6/NTAB) family NADH-FMN oxidoreductase RutF